jgi:phosphatidylglycerol:prolipoprotein diacylglycerol transferase
VWPILFEVGGHAVHTWGVLAAVGFLLVAWLGLRRADRAGIPVDRATDALGAAAAASVVGARGLYVLEHLDTLDGPLAWLDVRAGGASFFGALLLAVPVATLVAILRGVPLLAGWDAFAPAVALGFALARVGCFAAGCCYGAPTDLPWGVSFPGHPLPVHPTQLLEAAFQAALGVALLARGSRLPTGGVFAVWLGATGVGRFFLEFLRGDPGREGFGGLTEPQWLALVAVGTAFAVGLRIRRKPLVAAPPVAGAPGADA